MCSKPSFSGVLSFNACREKSFSHRLFCWASFAQFFFFFLLFLWERFSTSVTPWKSSSATGLYSVSWSVNGQSFMCYSSSTVALMFSYCLDTQLLIRFQIIFTFEVSALCWQVTVNVLSMSIFNKVFSLLEVFQLINSFIFWCFHVCSLPFYATGLHAQVSQSYPLNSMWYSVWSFAVLVVSPNFMLETVFNEILLVWVFFLAKFIGKSTK